MTLLIPNWDNENQDFESNHVFNLVNLFSKTEQNFTVLLLNHFPYFRYKLNEYSTPKIEYWNAYDELQNINIKNGFPLTIDEVYLPEKCERVYTNFGVLLVKNFRQIGEVYYNKYGFISMVEYLEDDHIYRDYYDDRGFLTMKESRTLKHKIIKREYFNELGLHTMTENLANNNIFIEDQGRDGLKGIKFNSIQELLVNILNWKLKQEEQQKIISITDSKINNITSPLMKYFSFINLVPDTIDIPYKELLKVLHQSSKVITDTSQMASEIYKLKIEHLITNSIDINVIPMFNLEMELGKSNMVEPLIMYWRLDDFDTRHERLNEKLLDLLIRNEDYNLTIECSDKATASYINENQRYYIDKHFEIDSQSVDFQKVVQFVEDNDNKKHFTTAELAHKGEDMPGNFNQLLRMVQTYKRINIIIKPQIDVVQQTFQQARIYIDVSDQGDLFRQTFALRVGIPQIIKRKTDYLVDNLNGKIVNSIPQTIKAIEKYMKNLGQWNGALVESVSLLEKYSEENILAKWKEVIYD